LMGLGFTPGVHGAQCAVCAGGIGLASPVRLDLGDSAYLGWFFGGARWLLGHCPGKLDLAPRPRAFRSGVEAAGEPLSRALIPGL
jgi:hypothetical protein